MTLIRASSPSRVTYARNLASPPCGSFQPTLIYEPQLDLLAFGSADKRTLAWQIIFEMKFASVKSARIIKYNVLLISFICMQQEAEPK